MTSRSHKKPRTTQPSTTRATPIEPLRGRDVAREAYARAATRHLDLADLPRAEPLWVPAGLMAVLVTLISALGAFGGELADSGWSGTAGSTASSPPTRTQEFRAATPRAALTAAPRATPGAVNRGSVRLVAFEPEVDGPAMAPSQHGSARVKSIVVDNTARGAGYRVAQDDDLLEGFEQPFGGEAPPAGNDQGFGDSLFDEPPMDEPSMDEPRLDEELPPLDPFDEASDPLAAPPSPSDNPPDDDPLEGDLFDDEPIFERDRDRLEGGLDGDTQPLDTSSSERERVMKNCAEELADLKASTIAEINLSIAPTGNAGYDYPFECGIDDGTPFAGRDWAQVTYMWKATALCHKPLYFEDVQLERYGHSWGPAIQPLVSGVHFFTRIPVLPYCMGITAPNECIYTLGHYRPGSCAPYMIPAVPFTWRAAALQGAAATGAAFAIP